MKYHYFLYYKAKFDDRIEERSAETIRRQKIKTNDNIREIEKELALSVNAKCAVLCNYIFLRRSIK